MRYETYLNYSLFSVVTVTECFLVLDLLIPVVLTAYISVIAMKSLRLFSKITVSPCQILFKSVAVLNLY